MMHPSSESLANKGFSTYNTLENAQGMRKGSYMTDKQADNTYVFDPESASEMARLIDQARTIAIGMGGIWVGLPEPANDAQVLDLACGPGGWVLDVAYAYPKVEVAGVDVSQTMIAYANARARSQGLNNATFGVINILHPLDFSENSFDVVTARALFGVLKREAWKPFLAECLRILKPGGVLRLTEPNDFGITSSPAIERIQEMGARFMWKAGYGFSVDGRSFGIAPRLPSMLRESGFTDVHHLAHAVDFSANTPAWIDFYRNYEVTFAQGKRMNIAMGLFTEAEYDQLYQQFLIEMRSEDFWGMSQFLSAFGQKPL